MKTVVKYKQKRYFGLRICQHKDGTYHCYCGNTHSLITPDGGFKTLPEAKKAINNALEKVK